MSRPVNVERGQTPLRVEGPEPHEAWLALKAEASFDVRRARSGVDRLRREHILEQCCEQLAVLLDELRVDARSVDLADIDAGEWVIEHPMCECYQGGPVLRCLEYVEGPLGEEWHGTRERVGGLLDHLTKAGELATLPDESGSVVDRVDPDLGGHVLDAELNARNRRGSTRSCPRLPRRSSWRTGRSRGASR